MKLTDRARTVLEILKEDGEAAVEEIVEHGFDQATVNRALLELEEEELVRIEEESSVEFELTEKGEEVLERGSPEYRLLQEVGSARVEVSEIDAPQVGIGKARSKGWIEISAGTVRKTDAGAEIEEDPVRQRLESGRFDEELQDRGLVESRQRTRRRASLTQRGHELDLESVEVAFDVESRTRTPRAGRKHFYKRIMDEARKVWLEMGFEEMDGDYVVSSLFNFDALYTPQDHPAREMQDTFFVENPERSDLSDLGNLVSNIEATHEHGWTTGSTGWGYDWSEEEAERNVLRTHTTSISAMKLHELEREQLPKKYFIVGRNFRNETLDRHHLAEFYQTDGIVVGEELSFRNLKGYISEFFRKMGYEEFRLVPSYYPYTEMSVEVQVHDGEEWIGLGGAGMFRPEVVKPLLGFEARVLAWGLGIPRIAMRNAGLEDIRELYRNDLEILENTAAWRRE